LIDVCELVIGGTLENKDSAKKMEITFWRD
jgi:hypothetical protein